MDSKGRKQGHVALNIRWPRCPLVVFVSLALFLSLSGFTFLDQFLAPKADLWARWSVHDPGSQARIDHAPWDRFLASYVKERDERHLVDYAVVTETDRAKLTGYLANLSAVPIGAYNRSEQFAFWVNLYNAVTVDLILKHYPVAGIRAIDISPGVFSQGPWDAKLVKVEGIALSLNDIEHRILRPIWRDPRIHYVVNCAALGCPDLPMRALTLTRSEAMLEAAARRFINQTRALRRSNGGLEVSSIYVWFREDFGEDDAAVIDHLARYVEGKQRELLKAGRISGHDYDWRLNDYSAVNPPS
jgi:hypothetical protein